MNENGNNSKENFSNKNIAESNDNKGKPTTASDSTALPTTSRAADIVLPNTELTVTYVGIKRNENKAEVNPIITQPKATTSAMPLPLRVSQGIFDSEEELNNIEPFVGSSSFHAVVAYSKVTNLKTTNSNTTPPIASIIPPSYSTVIKFPPPAYRHPYPIGSSHSNIFTSRVPPPSYAEVEGLVAETSNSESSEEHTFGPEPQYIGCPRCSAIVITEIHLSNSKLTHFTALGLCLLGCWPCCLLPYFMESCKDASHYCPNCHYFFGVYRPLF